MIFWTKSYGVGLPPGSSISPSILVGTLDSTAERTLLMYSSSLSGSSGGMGLVFAHSLFAAWTFRTWDAVNLGILHRYEWLVFQVMCEGDKGFVQGLIGWCSCAGGTVDNLVVSPSLEALVLGKT